MAREDDRRRRAGVPKGWAGKDAKPAGTSGWAGYKRKDDEKKISRAQDVMRGKGLPSKRTPAKKPEEKPDTPPPQKQICATCRGGGRSMSQCKICFGRDHSCWRCNGRGQEFTICPYCQGTGHIQPRV